MSGIPLSYCIYSCLFRQVEIKVVSEKLDIKMSINSRKKQHQFSYQTLLYPKQCLFLCPYSLIANNLYY